MMSGVLAAWPSLLMHRCTVAKWMCVHVALLLMLLMTLRVAAALQMVVGDRAVRRCHGCRRWTAAGLRLIVA